MPKTIDEVIDFILANAPLDGEVCRKNPFTGGRFHYQLVDPAIRQLHDQGRFLDLEAYDIKGTNGMWNTDTGTNWELARKATKTLLQKIQQDAGKSLEEILPNITQQTFYTTPINRYNTTLAGMLMCVYDNSPYQALKDLAEHDQKMKPLLPVIEMLRHIV